MKKIYILLTATVITLAAQAQQLNLQSRVYFARLTSNPALTAYNGSTNVYGFFRDQWSGALSHPRMGGAIGEISLWNDRIGTGVEVMSYTGGVSQIIEAKLYGAYKIKLAQDHRLSLGMTGGIIQRGTNASQADREMVNNDPMLDMPKAIAFDMNIGLAYQWKKLTIGFAIPNLLDANTRVYGNRVQITNFKRNYLINGSYEISLAQDKFHLEPGFIMKINQLKQVALNLQVMADYKRLVFLGVGYDLFGGMPITAGVRISNIFTVAYTYQVPILQGVPFTPSIYSSHELTVGICFDKWMKKGDKAKDITAAAPEQTSYDSLLAKKASADSLTSTQKAVDSLALKLEALEQALADAQQQSETVARKKEQLEKLDALNKKLEEQQKQQAEAKTKAAAEAEQQAKAKEQAAKTSAEQQAKEKAEAAKAAAVAEQQLKEKAQATKAAAEAEQQAKANEGAAKAPPVKETPAPVAKTETKTTAQGYEIIPEAPALPAQTETKAAPKVGERFALGNISVERDGSKLHESSYTELDKLVNYLRLHKETRVRIVGHGDGYDIEEQSGFRSYKRARRVAEYLEAKGIPFAQFTYVGMGPRKPIADNSTEEGRAKNFRIEIEIIK